MMVAWKMAACLAAGTIRHEFSWENFHKFVNKYICGENFHKFVNICREKISQIYE